ncbi:MAG: response regulator transcription factor [Verrucomicrobia bacterium]|nr:response regulator transcription factor [Verrucomicrobiota bacterium]
MDSLLKILIADDHPIFRRGLCDVIETDPSLRLVGQASNGDEAVRLIRELDPDIAILDVNMPKLSGLEATRKLMEDRVPVKIVLLTMHEDVDLLNKALDLGVHAYVLKENAVEDLIAAVRSVADGKTFISSTMAGLLLRRRAQAEALRRAKPGLESLTPAERRILKLIAEDKTSKEIAEVLGCAVRTVETHRQNMSAKIGLSGSHSHLKFAYDNKSTFD